MTLNDLKVLSALRLAIGYLNDGHAVPRHELISHVAEKLDIDKARVAPFVDRAQYELEPPRRSTRAELERMSEDEIEAEAALCEAFAEHSRAEARQLESFALRRFGLHKTTRPAGHA